MRSISSSATSGLSAHSDYDIGSKCPGCQHIATQHIILRTPQESNAESVGDIAQYAILRLIGSGQNNISQGPSTSHTTEHVFNNGPTSEPELDLPGKRAEPIRACTIAMALLMPALLGETRPDNLDNRTF